MWISGSSRHLEALEDGLPGLKRGGRSTTIVQYTLTDARRLDDWGCNIDEKAMHWWRFGIAPSCGCFKG
jgi:hypothetical protein